MDTRLRLTLAASLVLAPLAPLTARLVHLQVLRHRVLETRAAQELNRVSVEAAPRADILDRNGLVLAQSVPSWACYADKRMVSDTAGLSQRLSPLLKTPASDIRALLRRAGRFTPLKERLSYEEAASLARARLESVGIVAAQERFYPNGSLARGVLGQLSSDGRGLSGVELIEEGRLAGRASRLRVIRDGSGRTIYRGAEKQAPVPEPLALTLDRNVQYYAEEFLREAAARFSIRSGVVAVQDPRTGELLAMAAHPANPLKNPLVQDTYEPGSTFKIVAAAAALEESLVRPDETFFCENGSYALAPGVVLHDHEPRGELTLEGILEHSSNIGIAKIAERLGAARLYRHSRAFGFGGKTGVALPGETAGSLRPPSETTRVSLAASSYGYGVAASPLQVLAAYSAVANGGILWEPRIVKDGSAPVKVRRVASAKTMGALAAMLETVVETGTGQQAGIAGYRVAGKTGTSRKLDPVTKKYSTSQYNASFVGFLPADNPQWTILVVLEDPKGLYYGAQVAAPVFSKLGRRLLTLKAIPPGATLAARPAFGARGSGAVLTPIRENPLGVMGGGTAAGHDQARAPVWSAAP